MSADGIVHAEEVQPLESRPARRVKWWYVISGIWNICFFTFILLAKIDDPPSAGKTLLAVFMVLGAMVGAALILLGFLHSRIDWSQPRK